MDLIFQYGLLLDARTDSDCDTSCSEAIIYAYSSNTILASDCRVVEFLPVILVPERINAIRSLSLSYAL